MKTDELLIKQLNNLYALLRIEAKAEFSKYIQYIDPKYEMQWFHKIIADKCQSLYLGEIKRLMVFVPPQHGKSMLTSRMFPTWVLANDPTRKIAIASYSADLSEGFNRDAQRIMADVPYQSLIGSRHKTFKPIENTQLYETGFGGFIKAVGLEGGLTGQPADIGIIDDPVKGYTEAYSKTTRDKVWEWYVNVFLTRLHNDSRQLLIMTRWHKDDLAGRILKNEADKWDILTIKAIREDLEDKNDPRKLGEALWEKRHSITKLSDLRSLSLRTFTALYQQNPVQEEGNIVKSSWFRRVSFDDFKRMLDQKKLTYFIDTAYTENRDNDPSGLLATVRLGNDLYIVNARKVYMKFPDFCRFVPQFVKPGYGTGSTIRIEPKANGLSVIDQLREQTKLNIVKTPSPTQDKETRLNVASVFVEAQRVVMVDGAWNDEFITEVCGFPAVEHDEYVDLLCYAIDHHLKNNRDGIELSNLFH